MALDRLRAIGAWMDVNGTAIHGTKPFAPYQQGKLRFTQGKDGTVNAIYLMEADESVPESVTLADIRPAQHASVRILGVDTLLAWTPHGSGMRVELPSAIRAKLHGALAWTLRVPARDR